MVHTSENEVRTTIVMTDDDDGKSFHKYKLWNP